MDDYLHLNRKRFGSPGQEEDADPESKDTDPADEVTNPGPEEPGLDGLELVDPPKKVENTDPYNSTGRFNIKDVDW